MTLTMNDIETKERIYRGLAYREVSAEVLHQIIDSGGWDKNKGFVKYSPIGAFLGVENGVYVASKVYERREERNDAPAYQ